MWRCRCSLTTLATASRLCERDCSVQRRHQKLMEEAPSPALDRGVAPRDGRGRHASAVRAVGLHAMPAPSSSSSMSDGRFYFMEMNTRVQVEHPVTEQITRYRHHQGAAAHRRRRAHEHARIALRSTPFGHAMEFRINAEDPVARVPPVPRQRSRSLETARRDPAYAWTSYVCARVTRILALPTILWWRSSSCAARIATRRSARGRARARRVRDRGHRHHHLVPSPRTRQCGVLRRRGHNRFH